MTRKTKLNPTLQQEVVNLLSIGSTIEDACNRAGISTQSYFTWLNKGMSGTQPYADFLDAVTRAQTAARVNAVIAIRTAVTGAEQVADDMETITETRLRKGEKGEQVPYEYTKTIKRKTVTKYPPDWRAAIEYLKRRDNKNWSDRVQVDLNIDITIVQRAIAALEDAGIDATEFFTKAIAKAEAKRTSGG